MSTADSAAQDKQSGSMQQAWNKVEQFLETDRAAPAVSQQQRQGPPSTSSVLWAEWRRGLKDLQNIVLNPWQGHTATHEEPGTIANPTHLEVYQDRNDISVPQSSALPSPSQIGTTGQASGAIHGHEPQAAVSPSEIGIGQARSEQSWREQDAQRSAGANGDAGNDQNSQGQASPQQQQQHQERGRGR
jgi:hypothetical protein